MATDSGSSTTWLENSTPNHYIHLQRYCRLHHQHTEWPEPGTKQQIPHIRDTVTPPVFVSPTRDARENPRARPHHSGQIVPKTRRHPEERGTKPPTQGSNRNRWKAPNIRAATFHHKQLRNCLRWRARLWPVRVAPLWSEQIRSSTHSRCDGVRPTGSAASKKVKAQLAMRMTRSEWERPECFVAQVLCVGTWEVVSTRAECRRCEGSSAKLKHPLPPTLLPVAQSCGVVQSEQIRSSTHSRCDGVRPTGSAASKKVKAQLAMRMTRSEWERPERYYIYLFIYFHWLIEGAERVESHRLVGVSACDFRIRQWLWMTSLLRSRSCLVTFSHFVPSIKISALPGKILQMKWIRWLISVN